MKKVLFFFLIVNLYPAQHPDLLNTDWKITKIINELSLSPWLPPSMPYPQVTHFSPAPSQVSSSFFNIVLGNLIYSGNNQFSLTNKTCTYADYWGDNGEVNQFFDQLCSFFTETTFNYQIQSSGTTKTLIISSPVFSEIHFEAANLSTSNHSQLNYIISTNPLKNVLNIENANGINSISIVDISGKMVYDMKNNNSQNIKINTEALVSGVYFVIINQKKSHKVIIK